MTNFLNRLSGATRNGRAVMAALAVASVLGLAAGPALADDRERARDEQQARDNHRDNDRRDNDRDGYRAYEGDGGPRYVYAPPAVVYTPYAPPALEFVFPLDIR
jgi:hypothetical protein